MTSLASAPPRSALFLPLLIMVSMTAPLSLNIILPSLPGFPATFSTSGKRPAHAFAIPGRHGGGAACIGAIG